MMNAEAINSIVSKYQSKREYLIPVLQEVQEHQGYISREAIQIIGKQLNLTASKIYGVATFYNQFKFIAPGKNHIQVCRGTACHVKGSANVLESIKRELKINPGETTRDGLFSLEVVACIGACGLAPVISINGEFHASITNSKLKKIFKQYRAKEVKK